MALVAGDTREAIDFAIYGEGSIWLIEPLTPRAAEWLTTNVNAEPWQWIGHCLAVDFRYTQDLVLAAREAGLTIRGGS